MKELALLMFFVGCGYALAKLIERFSPADDRRIFFAIPSQASFNVLWGFVFYLGFAALVIHHHHWLRLLFALTAVCLLGIILYRRELFRSVSAPEGRKFTGRLEKALLRQQQEDRRLNRSYSRTEALSVLGLPAATSADSPLPAQRMKMLDTLNQTANLPYLGDLLPQLQTALPLK